MSHEHASENPDAALSGFPEAWHQRPLPAIVLAAGLSTRMGAFKPLMMLGGETLLGRCLRGLRESGVIGEVVVVTGHRAMEVEREVGRIGGARCVLNEDYAVGEMLSSVRVGVGALGGAIADAGGFLLTFADQPGVKAATVGALVRAFLGSGRLVTLPTHLGKRGHPVILGAALVGEILALGVEDILRTVVHRHLAEAALVAVEDAWVLEDLDTPGDFARAEERLRGGRMG